MPVIRAGKLEETRPDWVRFSSMGIVELPREVTVFDRHFHDCDEYWFLVRGRMRAFSEGKEYELGPGDVLCTRMGDEHEILEIVEDAAILYVEEELKGKKRTGHLHRDPKEAEKAMKMIEQMNEAQKRRGA